MKKLFTSISLLFLTSLLLAQNERAFHPDMFDDWKSLKSADISNNGRWVYFTAQQAKKQDSLILLNRVVNKELIFPQTKKAKFSGSSNYLLLERSMPYDTIRAIKLAKQNKEKWHGEKAELQGDSLQIYLFDSDSLLQFGEFERYEIAADSSDLLVATLPYPKKKKKKNEEEESKKSKKKKRKKKTKKKKKESQDSPKKKSKKKDTKFYKLMYFSNESGHQTEIDSVAEFSLSKYGNSLAYLKKSGDSLVLNILDIKLGLSMELLKSEGDFKQLTWDDIGQNFCFLHSTDTFKQKAYQLWLWKHKQKELTQITDSNSYGDSYTLRSFSKLAFSENSGRLFIYYGRSPRNEPEKDTVLNEEKAKLDLWSWTDGKLQTQQLHELKREKKASWASVYDMELGRLQILTDSTIDRMILPGIDTVQYALLNTNLPYRKQYSWDWPPYRDYYRIDLNTGKKDSLLMAHRSSSSLSPLAKFYSYYDLNDKNWWQIDFNGLSKRQLTRGQKVSWENELHDTPSPAYPYGLGGYTKGDSAVFIYDRYDIWLFHLYTGEAMRLTKGREEQVTYRIIKLDREEDHISLNAAILLSVFDWKDKSAGFAQLKGSNIEILAKEDKRFTRVKKARNSDELIFRESSYQKAPDLILSNRNLTERDRLSKFSEQMEDYDIGSVELTSWKHPEDASKLEGLIYKPAGFDSSKTYPMLVYFYERNSNNLNRFWHPRPTASIIYPSMYASLGYIVFVPDIKYTEGQPGKDALWCIDSGVEHMLKKGYVDNKKIGLQGQSWGGYQTAYLITQTDRYAAAMAGAPVSNMTSAYGGIRWGSGYSRMFQYERTQSRIGANLWEARDRYIENSPVFFADKVQTPLLIMHNDNDGAVPWYQGIEYFVALRRLNKPVWLLNYNGDAHNLRKMANKEDLSIRMMQFFDHYLKDEARPEWMDGIPALRKGIDYGLELKSE